MNDGERLLALNNGLTEIKKVYPEIRHSLIFDREHVIAKDKETEKETAEKTKETIISLTEKAKTIGATKRITFKGTKGTLNVVPIQNCFLATATTSDADEKTVNSVTRAIVPVISKVLAELNLAQAEITEILENSPETTEEPAKIEIKELEATVKEDEPQPAVEKSAEEEIEVNELEPEPVSKKVETEPKLPQGPTNKFTVDNVPGISRLGNDNLVHVDAALIGQWAEIFGEDKIVEAILQNPVTKQTLRCKFDVFKDSKFDGTGVVQMSDKMQVKLQTKKGEQILIRPATEPAPVTEKDAPKNEEDKKIEPKKEKSKNEKQKTPSRYVFRPAAKQLMVENLTGFNGLLKIQDIARIDAAVMDEWNELYNKESIEEVTVEDPVTGKIARCKLKLIKDSKSEDKSTIQLSTKVLSALQIQKGALILIRPVVEG